MSCKDLFLDVEELTEEERAMIENGSCFDPEMASVEGTTVHSDVYSWFVATFSEELASEKLIMFYSYNIFDSEDPDKPIKTSLKRHKLKKHIGYNFELILHNLELSDNIYSPFASTEKLSYLTMKEFD